MHALTMHHYLLCVCWSLWYVESCAVHSGTCRKQLDALDIPYQHPFAKHGIVATLGSGKAPCMALRTDMDALPIPEELDVPYKSTHPGLMHACGHDAHMTMLLGAAKYLKAHEAELQGTVKLLFQPAEEGGAGAKVMVDEGAMQGVSAVFGLHVWPTAPSGTIQTRIGTLMAGTDKFLIRVTGISGHGGTPHLVRDSVVAGAAIVMNLQPLISRETDPAQGGIVGITLINSGPGSPNVHAEWVELQGTVNSFSTSGLHHLKSRLEEIVTSTATMYGCKSSIKWNPIAYIPVENSEAMVKRAEQVATQLSQVKHFVYLDRPSFMAEDIAFFNDVAEGAFIFLGIGNASLQTDQKLHTPRFRLDDTMLPVGAALHASVAMQYLQDKQQGKPQVSSTSYRTSIEL
ncbi:TPA: hypothetical protein ACH3X2_012815 [Trebouxia sp. C0005]